VLWPTICEFLLLSDQSVYRLKPGTRLQHWISFLDAISREPLFGYGWQQVGAAQQRVALDHPVVGEFLTNCHNVLLDLFVWNGLPIGAFITITLVFWLVHYIRTCRNVTVACMLLALGGVITHAMLEYPLSYSYFLIPFGLAMGAIEGISPIVGKSICLSRPMLLSISVFLSALFGVVATDYSQDEEKFRTLRFELARISGETKIVAAPVPEEWVLTQLEAFLKFYRLEAKPGMSPDQLDWMRKVSERYGFSTVLLRYALAAGLNGRPEIARATLDRICKIHAPIRCREARESWIELQKRYPELMNIAAPEPE